MNNFQLTIQKIKMNFNINVSPTWSLVEAPFKAVGLYNVSPLTRGTVVTVATGVFLYYLKPATLFNEDGEPKPYNWKPLDGRSVPIPWWAVASLAGTASALFI